MPALLIGEPAPAQRHQQAHVLGAELGAVGVDADPVPGSHAVGAERGMLAVERYSEPALERLRHGNPNL